MSQQTFLSPMPGVIHSVECNQGDEVKKGKELVIIEAMKMETAICAPDQIRIESIAVEQGQIIQKGDLLFKYITIGEDNQNQTQAPATINKEKGQTSHLAELQNRQQWLLDENRTAAVEKRKARGHNTARENLQKLVDPTSFNEIGSLIVAAQLSRRTLKDLIEHTPADGLITGTCTINSESFTKNTECAVFIYDYSVLAGTQGTMNHMKMDRMLSIAHKNKLPVILFAEGGGGRPGDVDQQTIAGLHISTFTEFARLNGTVPVVSIVNGYCFAGNAALAGSSDIIIGTKSLSLGMGGPAMIEGGGLGKVHPKEVGPYEVHLENGVIDVLVENEDEAIVVCKRYLSYFQGPAHEINSHTQQSLRDIIPENRKRVYEMRALIATLCDKDSVLELREHYGKGIISCLVRIGGHAFGLIANNPSFEAGAITAENAIKAAEFLNLCNTHQLPIISLVDTPGIMVGVDSEKTGNVKHASRLFVTGAKLTVPLFGIVVRRAYGLGAMAMVGGSMRVPNLLLAWPTGEFGAMGLEGAVKLGFRKELEAIQDPIERETVYNNMVEQAYERGKALSMATMFEIDDVIDPAQTRHRIISAYQSTIKHET